MLMKDVHPQTAFIMQRAQSVIYADNGSIPATIPLTRILAMNKNLLMIDNRDRFVFRERYTASRNSGNDFIFAAVTNIEPWEGGNIFCCGIFTPDDLVDQIIKESCRNPKEKNDFFHSSISYDMRTLVKLGLVYLNSIMKMGQEGNISSFQILPSEVQRSYLKASPELMDHLKASPLDTSWGVAHPGWLAQLWMKANPQFVNPFAKSMYGETMDFSKPPAFPPGQAPTSPNTLKEAMSHVSPLDNAAAFGMLNFLNGKQDQQQAAPSVPPQQTQDFFGRPINIPKAPQGGYAPAVNKQFPEDFGYHAKEDKDPVINPNINPEKMAQPNGKVQFPQNLDSAAVASLINALTNNGASNFASLHPNVASAYINEDGGVVLSYNDGSISPVITINNESKFGVDTDALDAAYHDEQG